MSDATWVLQSLTVDSWPRTIVCLFVNHCLRQRPSPTRAQKTDFESTARPERPMLRSCASNQHSTAYAETALAVSTLVAHRSQRGNRETLFSARGSPCAPSSRMKIEERSKLSGLTRSTIRIYEDRGLLTCVTRGGSGYGDYPPEAVAALQHISVARQVDFKLGETKLLLGGHRGRKHRDKRRALLQTKLTEIEETKRCLAESKLYLRVMLTVLSRHNP